MILHYVIAAFGDVEPERVSGTGLDRRYDEPMPTLATKAGAEGPHWHVRAPLIELSKAEIIRAGVALGVDYALTHSCYDPVGEGAGGRCGSCLLRKKGFAEAGVPDPTRYAS